MNILLVYPRFPASFWSYTYALRIYNRKALLPPLGLLTIAAMLPETWGKKVVDLNVCELTDAHLQWADAVFLGGMAVQRGSAHEIARRCKTAGKLLIAGGPLFSGEYSLFPEIEHFMLSEGELLMPQLVADLQKGTVKRLYRSREFADMSTSPTPLWNLIDVNDYAVMGIQYTRGCPYDCEFCNVTALLGRAPRTKTAGQIIAELDGLRAAGWDSRVFFVDDNLIGHRPALRKELLPALIEWQKRSGPIPFCTQASINLADDPKLMEEMTDAGFDQVFVGIETTDPAALEECHKSQNRNRNILDSVKTLQRGGIEVQAGFIVGFDHDSAATFEMQANFIANSGIVTAMVGQLQAPPGTKLITRMWQEGRLRGHSTGDNTDGSTNIIPKMGVEALRDGYRVLLEKIFSPRASFARIKTFLREFSTPKIRRRITFSDYVGFLRSLYSIGVVGRERWEYWKLLAWALFTRPRHLPQAIRLGVCANHYRRIMEDQMSRPAPEPMMIETADSGETRVTVDGVAI